MPGPINTIVLTLLEATVTLYPADRQTGQPVLASPLWHGVAAADLTVRDRWIKVETRPTGAAYPHKHNLAPQFELSLGRVWALPLAQLAGFNPARAAYVLDVVWKDEESFFWHRATYYGVTISERTRAAHDRDGEFTDEQVFDAEYVSAPVTGRGTVPALTNDLPLTVRYVSATEDTLLYYYDPATAAFTEAAAGIATGRAALGYDPVDKSGVFNITFAGEDWSAFRLNASGEVEAMAFRVGAPTTPELPRVEWFYGNNRIGTVTTAGFVYANSFRAQPIIPTPAAGFQLFSNSAVNAFLDAEALYAIGFKAFQPNQITGLKLWVAFEDLSTAAYTFATWPDRSATADLAVVGDVHNYLADDPLFHLEPDGRGFVYLDKDTGAHLRNNAAGGFATDNHCLFVVGKPGQIDGIGGGSNMALIGSGDATAAGDFALAQYANVLTGNFWTSVGRESVSGTTPIATRLVADETWRLFEQEVSGTSLKIRLNGALEGQATLLGTKAGESRELFVGADNGLFASYGGLLRAVLAYTGSLSADQKGRVRQYLNNTYTIY